MDTITYGTLMISAASPAEKQAAEIFAEEIRLRTGKLPAISESACPPCVVFRSGGDFDSRDAFSIDDRDGSFILSAEGIRGLLFAAGLFLRKTEYKNGTIRLTEDITGKYSPDKPIRGHQLGYRPTPNTYDKWHPEDYYRYYLDMMFFGVNTVEHMAYENGSSNRNEIMDYDEEELLAITVKDADSLDLDISLWSPNCEDTKEEAVINRERVFGLCRRFNALFPPGGDPGELAPKELFDRCKGFNEVLKKYHPEAGVWPSAQAPHNFDGWGEAFINELETAGDSIAGVIHGPNHAFELDELRRRVPARYPIRFYPDITHNVRCEYPVHFLKDDWHYALCAVNGRESVNPRPAEYALLHKITEKYVVGSVSYSEGVNDDFNKMLWSALDFDPRQDIRTITEDYVRLFFYGADTDALTDAILGLEKNWEGAPDSNPQIAYTYSLLTAAAEKYPFLKSNYRYNMLLLRAECDKLVRLKMLCGNASVKKAEKLIRAGRLSEARKTLENGVSDEAAALRKDIDRLAKTLFEQIGMQLGTKDYYADGWERGAILDTVDLPVTDREWLLGRFAKAEKMSEEDAKAYMLRSVDRNRVGSGEYYFSLALDGLDALNTAQTPAFYMDFQGDRPNKNTGELPVCMFKLFDHFVFRAKTAGFEPDTDYTLMITYKNSPDENAVHHRITANGVVIYDGKQFGGETNTEYVNEKLPEGYTAQMYTLPAEVFANGCVELEVSEPLSGCEICEFRITKKPYGGQIK